MDYVKHKPGGGDVEIFNEKMTVKAKSKCGTFDNISHRAGGGDIEIFHEKQNKKLQNFNVSNLQKLKSVIFEK